ncbi:alginate export family protein [Flavobacterium phycosphaerae]|uniref:alginate export family protein n=1 Tax=Flavobacterium phycosphaerae TaxID=2697515 RepID=UPI00138957CB|nr:alginate export family protein [Flavobacterium phycosphaerae]
MNSKKILFIITSFFAFSLASAQSSDDILNLLIQKGVVKQADADSIRADYAIKQQEKPKDKSLTIDLMLKNRFEVRNGYASIPSENSAAALFVNQRTRLSLNYQHNNLFNSVVSFQDVRVWGMHDPRGLNGTVQLFEGYVEPFLSSSFSIRIGRQRIIYDNQRLFAENEWQVNARAHDAITFKYHNNKLSVELASAFNQANERVFGTDFTPSEPSITPANASPSSWTNYKALGVNYIKYDLTPTITATSIVVSDGYQDTANTEKIFWRFTYGGRLEYTKKNWYVTASGYIQSGRNATGKTIEAWYLQPEVKYSQPDNFMFRLGAEIFSGDKGTIGEKDHNFVPLYGVAHRFNGFMDLFTKFPGDLNNAGLVNPYLFIIKNITSKLEIGSYNHLFFTQRNFVDTNENQLTKYMGYEHDLLLTYKPNSYFNLEGGFCFALPTETMTTIKKSGEAARVPTWFYLQCKFTPRLLKNVFN